MGMTDLSTANALADERGFDDWSAQSALDRTRALIRAGDHLRRYKLRAELTADEQTLLDLATLLVARDLLTNDTPLSLRSAPQVVKEAKEGAGFKKSVEYGEAPADPYPDITALLASLCVVPAGSSFAIGKLVR